MGELLQGIMRDGQHFHVSLPVEHDSVIHLEMVPAQRWEVVGVTERPKLGRGILLAGERVSDAPMRATVVARESDIPVGAGCGSSTADVIAGMRAVSDALSVGISDEELFRMAAEIESSDALPFRRPVVANHRTGELIEHLEWFPPFEMVAVIPSSRQSTEAVAFEGQHGCAATYESLLSDLRSAVSGRDIAGVAQVATRSAALNRRWLGNPLADELARSADKVGALGVVVAHTGTAAAWLFAPGDREQADYIAGTLRSGGVDARKMAVLSDARGRPSVL